MRLPPSHHPFRAHEDSIRGQPRLARVIGPVLPARQQSLERSPRGEGSTANELGCHRHRRSIRRTYTMRCHHHRRVFDMRTIRVCVYADASTSKSNASQHGFRLPSVKRTRAAFAFPQSFEEPQNLKRFFTQPSRTTSPRRPTTRLERDEPALET